MRLNIGIFDSGLGGLTVYKKLKHRFPHLSFAYLSDHKRSPYGIRSINELQSICLDNCRFLSSLGVERIVIACHTASIAAFDYLSKELLVPIHPMHTSTEVDLMSLKLNSSILILGTVSTIGQGFYQKVLKAHRKDISIKAVACPYLVEYIENQKKDPELLEQLFHLYAIGAQNFDYVLLACTHFPWIKKEIQNRFPSTTTILDPAESIGLNNCSLDVDSTVDALDQFYIHGDLAPFSDFIRQNISQNSPISEITSSELKYFVTI